MANQEIKEDRWQEFLDIEGNQFTPLSQQVKPDRWQEFLDIEKIGPTIPEGGETDWREELIGGLLHKATKRSADISSGKYMEPIKTKRYWIEMGKNASKGVSQFLQSITGMPGMDRRGQEDARVAAMKKVGGEKPSIGKVAGMIGKDVGKMAFEFGAFLPRIGIALAVDPVKEVRDNPVGVGLFVLSVVGASGAKLRAKARAGRPMPKDDMAKAVDSVPEYILTKQQKAKLKSALPEQMELPLGNIEKLSPYQKIVNAIKEAKPARKEQEVLYKAERARRFTKAEEVGKKVKGEKGYYAETAELKGELPKLKFESIRNKLTQADMDSMFNLINDSPRLSWLEGLPAKKGLAKLFGEYGGAVPTEGELFLLNKVFPKGFVQTIMSKRSMWDKIKGGMLEAANVPRALMASFDLSFGLRQGVFLAARYPKEFARSFIKQFKLFGSDKAFKALKEEIASRPTYKLMKRHGEKQLALTEMDAGLSLREEAFMGAVLAEKIPLVGKGVRASNRAYTGFANKLRADVFDHLIKSAEKTGRNPWKDSKLVDSIINFVNAGSGRGSIKAFEKIAVELNTVLFSPKLIASRLNLLSPKFYIKLDPFVRKQALQSLFAFAGAATTVLGLARLAGAEVETNMRSADAGKIRIGDTRIDIMGGFQQYLRTAVQFVTGQIKSTTTGRMTEVGKGFMSPDRISLIGKGLEYKLAPVASFAVALLRGHGPFGGDIPSEAAKKFVPMVMQDIYELAKEDPELLPVSVLGIFGTGIQTYKPRGQKVIY